MSARHAKLSAISIAGALLLGGPTCSADEPGLLEWSQAAARGMFDLCRTSGPDAAQVIEHGEVWGWPPFMGYQETPDGYRREAGGQSRRTYTLGDESASVEASVQSGEVTSAAPAHIQYFRCYVAADQPIDTDLEAYFTGIFGPPTNKSDKATVWLLGAAAGAAGGDDDASLRAVVAGGSNARGQRIELSREFGRDQAKLTLFEKSPSP